MSAAIQTRERKQKQSSLYQTGKPVLSGHRVLKKQPVAGKDVSFRFNK